MSIELTVLRLLKDRKEYDRLARAIPKGVLEQRTEIILDDYGRYFREHPDATSITPEPFWLWFKLAHKTLNDDQRAFYQSLITQDIKANVPDELKDGIMSRIIAGDYANKLTKMLERYALGEDVQLGQELRTLVDAFEQETAKKVKVPWVNDDIADLLKEDENDTGFHWRLPELNGAMRPLRGGDAGIVAGRPDTGKTTFLTDQLSFFAPQVDEVYPGENRYILWFNNEGPGKRIVTRFYQSALNATTPELVEKSTKGTLRQEYAKLTGRPDIIRVFDIHDFWNHEVEDLIKKFPPAIIVFDMVDNIKFGGAASNNGQRTDQLLEAMYQWARIIAVKHDCAVIMASQISADGENLAYPSLSMLKDSKTGKQGAADWIVTLGYLNDYPDKRFIGMTKNKLPRTALKNPKAEVHFDGLRGRYVSHEMIKEQPDGI